MQVCNFEQAVFVNHNKDQIMMATISQDSQCPVCFAFPINEQLFKCE